MNILVDEAKCVGAGQCVMAAPEVFDQRDEDGIVVLLKQRVGPDEVASIRDAAALCPAAAIKMQAG
jgi:ferredoxin